MTATAPEITVEIVPANLGLAPEAKQSLELSFAEYFEKARQFKAQSESITSAKLARAARLEVKALRVAAEKTRKELKEDSLRMGKAIDGANNILLAMIVPIEQRLEDIEKEDERKEEARIAALHAARADEIAPYRVPEALPYTRQELGRMDDATWAATLQDAKDLHELREERARKAEADRIAKEKAEAEERERQRAEIERLRKEAAEREAKAKAEREAAEKAQREAAEKARKEREAIEAKAKAEREAADRELARIKAEADKAAREEALRQQALREVERKKAEAAREAQRKAEAELAAAQAAKEEAEKAAAAAAAKAARAPEKTKMRAFASTVRSLTPPTATTEAGKRVAADIAAKTESFAKWIEAQAETL